MKFKKTILAVAAAVVALSAAAEYIVHPWEGKTVAYFGDSITDPRNKASKKKYWSYLEEWLGITPYVYGVSGREWNDIPRQTAQLKKEHGDSVDAIMIFIGTNDNNNAVAIGRWYDERMDTVTYGHRYPKRTEDRKRRIPCMDPDTYRGRINIALDSLKRTYPEKQIVLLTPIHRCGFYANDKNWQVPEDYANRAGEYLDAYVESVIEAGRIWSVPVIDLNSLCGLYPLIDEHSGYYKDGRDQLHPNDHGHERMARTLYYQLIGLPCRF